MRAACVVVWQRGIRSLFEGGENGVWSVVLWNGVWVASCASVAAYAHAHAHARTVLFTFVLSLMHDRPPRAHPLSFIYNPPPMHFSLCANSR